MFRSRKLKLISVWLLGILLLTTILAQAGDNQWASLGPEGSAIYDLIIDPTAPQTLYAASDGNNGILKSTNGGSSWSSLNIGLTDPWVTALILDPMAPQTLYAGTNGDGILKTTNGGDSWTTINVGLTTHQVGTLALDPTDPEILYAGTAGGGMFKSINGGDSWFPINTGLTSTNIAVLGVDPNTPQIIYAGGSGMFKSIDGGNTWQAINTGLVHGQITTLAIDATTSQNLYVGALWGTVHKSINGGETWEPIDHPVFATTWVDDLVIDQTMPATIYAGTAHSGVLKSIDGGNNWFSINTELTEGHNFLSLAIDPTMPEKLYAGSWGNGLFVMTQLPQYELSLTQEVLGVAHKPGDAITFTLDIKNTGIATVTGVIITDTIPSDILTTTWSSSFPDISVSDNYVWTLSDLAPEESGIITVSGIINPKLPSDFAIVNVASIKALEAENNLHNNTSSVIVGGVRVYLPIMMK